VKQAPAKLAAKSRSTGHWSPLGICLGLIAAAAAVYAPVAQFDFVNYDDPDYITANAHVCEGLTAKSLAWAFTSTEHANWFPLTRISEIADVQMFGMWAGGHHLVNVILHAASALAWFAVIKRITGARWPAAFIALIFAIHPLHIESVAWIAERKDVLSGLFWALTLWAYLKYADRPGAARYATVLALFVCGLMSKPMIVTLPVVLLLIDYWRERPITRRVLIEKIPLLALAAGSSVITYIVQQRGGAVVDQIPLSLRLGNACVSCVVYLVKFVWPSNLAVFYPYPASIPIGLALAAGAALLGITALALRRGTPRYLTVGWLWYVITLAPVIGLVQVGVQARADRYTYVPLIGISIIVAFGVAQLPKRVAVACAIPASLAWAISAAVNIQPWRDSIHLFEHAIESTDRNYVAYEGLGNALRDAGRGAEAIAAFERAIEIKPGFAEGQNNLGQALLTQGRIDDATPHILEAVRLEPKSAEARVNFGSALRARGMLDQAEAQYRAAVAIDSENAGARRGLATVLGERGKTAEAIEQFKESLRLKPDDADTHYNLGRLLAQLNRMPEATAQFAEAARLQPGSAEAHYNLGNTYAAAGDFQKAASEFQAAVRFNPGYAHAHFNLASALANLERYREAAAEFDAVIKLQPDFPDARRNRDACLQLARNQ
jgi:protein O-mannosyl-transferase